MGIHITPRQADILGLAASGLSDKEIALRLGISHRTVRTHLEKLFQEHGLHSRAGGVALWFRHKSQAVERPVDECPFPKPFLADFDECPAFQPTETVTLDLFYRPLAQMWNCRHLVGRLVPGTPNRGYGACLIGDADARHRWASAVGAGRLRRIRLLRQLLAPFTSAFMQRLWEIKRRQLLAVEAKQNVGTATTEMEALAAEFMTGIQALMEEHRVELAEINVPLDACVCLIRVSLDRLITQESADVDWEVPDRVLAGFPEEVRLLLKPPCGVLLPGEGEADLAPHGQGKLSDAHQA